MEVEIKVEDIPTYFPSCNFLFLFLLTFLLFLFFFFFFIFFYFYAFQKTRMMMWRSFRISEESM